MALYLGNEQVKLTQGSKVEIEPPAIRQIIEGTISEYSNSRVSIVGSFAFRNCNSLTSINLPQVTSIGSYAFYYCTSLTSINLPQAISISNCAFAYCRALTSINLPQAISISNYTFRSCYNLLSLYLLGSSIPLVPSIAFQATPISNYTTSTGGVYGSIYVPASLYNSYIVAANWSYYSSRIVGISWNQLTSENCTMVSATVDGTNYYLGATLAYHTTVISAPTIKVTFKGQEYICSQYSGTMNGYTTYAYGADSDIPTLTPHFDDGHPFLLWCQTRNNINLNNIVIDSNIVEEGEIVSIKIEEQVNSLP